MSAHGSAVGKEPCPECGSQDNVAVYEDGYKKCFGMGCNYYAMPDGGEPAAKAKAKRGAAGMLEEWDYLPITKRNLSEETATKWKYGVGTFKGKKVQVANYIKDGQVTAQKVRFANKDFLMLGDSKNCGLYGQHLWRDGGKYLCITEGEIDAMSVSQMFGHKYPVVSIPNGAQGAVRSIKKELEWVEQFENVILMFDSDKPGQDAAQEVAAILSPGKVKIASLPLKDPNEMLKAARGGELITAFWNAKAWRPDGIVTFADIKEKVFTAPEMGTPWMFEELTALTFGRRPGVYTFGAGTGIGKTDLLTQQIMFDANVLNIKCGVLFLEQPPEETAKRLAGKLAGKRFHLPQDDGNWTTDDLVKAYEQLEDSENILLYDHFGTSDWEVIQSRIRYMAVSCGCKHIYLDHLTALASHAEDERRELESLMAEIAGMAMELNIVIHLVSHLATPEGKPHEEGGRCMIRHFKGSRAIGYWSHCMFALERSTQDPDPEKRKITTFRCLKDRHTGQATGATLALLYDHDTSQLTVGEFPQADKKVDFDDDGEF